MSLDFNQRSIAGSDKVFGCEYCPFVFKSQEDRFQHTATHFKSESCTICHKLLLCINGDWYGLHVSQGCHKNDDQQYVPIETYIDTEIKTEAYDFEYESELKSEVDDYDDFGRDNGTFHPPPIEVSHVEVTLLPVVRSSAELKRNLTTTPTKDVSTQDKQQILCTECNKSFSKRSNLNKHRRIYHSDSTRSKLKEQDDIHHIGSQSEMQSIPQLEESPSSLREHTRSMHLNKQRFLCTECSTSFSNRSNLNKHRKKFHSDSTRSKLKEQEKIHHIEPQSEMQLIPRLEESSENLKRNSLDRMETSPVVKPQEIGQSKLQRKNETSAIKRNKPASNEKPFTDHRPFTAHRPIGECYCDICGKSFKIYECVKKHIYMQHCSNKEQHSCDECHKTFPTRSGLNKHKKIHLKCKAYICSYCGRGFNTLEAVNEHSNQHTGVKPYKCKYCEKLYFRKSSLRKHIRIHTRERPYKCTIENCDRTFMYDVDIKRHRYSAHGIYHKKFICQICDKVFPENKFLVKHLQQHSPANFGLSALT